MNISLVVVGKLKESYLREGVAEYVKRLAPYCRLSVTELVDEPVSEDPAKQALAKAREGERIAKAIKNGQWVIALDVDGVAMTSVEFATYMEGLATQGKSDVAFLIGGASGFAPEVASMAQLRLSLSRMTFTHQLARLVFLEQLYRSFRIRRGEPYHY